MSTWVVRVEDNEGAVYSYAFQIDATELPQEVGQSLAESFQMTLVDVMHIHDFLRGDVYELCSV